MPALWRWDGRAGPFSGSGAACTCGTSTTRTPSPPRPSALASHPHPRTLSIRMSVRFCGSVVSLLSQVSTYQGPATEGTSPQSEWFSGAVASRCRRGVRPAGARGRGGAVQLQEWEGHGADTSCHRLSLDVRPAPGARRVYMRRLAAATHCPSRPERLVTVTTCYRFTFNCQMRT